MCIFKHDRGGVALIADRMGLGSIRGCEHPRVHGRSLQGAQTDMWGDIEGKGKACCGCGQHLLTGACENGKGKLAEGRVAPGKTSILRECLSSGWWTSNTIKNINK